MAVQLRADDAPRYAPAANRAEGPAERTTREALAMLFGPPAERRFLVRLWTGAVEGPTGAPAPFTLVLRHPGALRRMFVPPTELNLAEAYLRDDYDVEGDLIEATLLADDVAARLAAKTTLAKLTMKLLALPGDTGHDIAMKEGGPYAPDAPVPVWRRMPHYLFRHHRARDLASVSFTYDTSNPFYELWLDERMVYTCAYFRRGDEDIHEAQVNKLEHVCRKLRLRPGERLLDIGCGWGALLEHAALHHGVTGYGVTLSKEQAAYANERFARRGIADRVRVEVRDYRDIPASEVFDKVAAVGVVEHVGVARLNPFFAKVYSLLRPGGLFLNHLIVSLYEPPARPGDLGSGRVLRQHNAFIQKYLFPDAEMPTITEVVANTEKVGFEVRDLESLREHYALTFRHWLRRYEERASEVKAIVGEAAYRAFRLYLAAFPPRFEGRWSGLSQVLLCRNVPHGRNDLPRTREDVHRDAGAPRLTIGSGR